MEATVVNGSGTETGQVITTTVGGRDGKPKQVIQLTFADCRLVREKLLIMRVISFMKSLFLSSHLSLLYFSLLFVSDDLIHGPASGGNRLIRSCISGRWKFLT